MAKAMNKAATSLLLIFLLIVSISESRISSNGSTMNSISICNKIYGAQSGDTCVSIIRKFKLTAEGFSSINPNLDCEKIFIGQWLCLDGVIS
ncbi:hypothetical protein P3S68_004521 [Capsicum galapagoense]